MEGWQMAWSSFRDSSNAEGVLWKAFLRNAPPPDVFVRPVASCAACSTSSSDAPTEIAEKTNIPKPRLLEEDIRV